MENFILQQLNTEFEKRKTLNSRYSLRAFARSLGISPGTLSQILNNKKYISPKVLEKIYSKLNVPESSFKELKDFHMKIKKRNSIKHLEKANTLVLDENVFLQISDWYYFAILELINTSSFESKTSWIANRLGIEVRLVEAAIKKLLELELIAITEHGHFFTTNSLVKLSDTHLNSDARRKRQKQLPELSKEKIDTVDIALRDHSSITAAIDAELIPEIQERIKNFRRDLGNFIAKNTKDADAVYELQIGFFPLTEEITGQK